ncbi:glycerate kinase [Listeria aquatica]|uniref:glycerate kinase n=1 Tax=Listeria aquatica TaxID=1494960 RepID=UPI003EFB17B8
MKIVIAPDSFKETLSADKAAMAIQTGFLRVFPEVEYHLLPVGDGGEGTLDVLAKTLHTERRIVSVTGPFLEPVNAQIAFIHAGQTAFIEMAEICGLQLVPENKRDPLTVSTRGVGEMMNYAMDQGAKEIIIGVGGTASNDGGIGMAAGLGYEFFDELGNPVLPIGKNLSRIHTMKNNNVRTQLAQTKIRVITDVTNPLTGPNGATFVFGGQKGLNEAEMPQVDQAMETFYNRFFGVPKNPGVGAGGGMGAGLLKFASAELKLGIDYVIEQLQLKEICTDADFVVVGEGRMDGQTSSGKAPLGVARAVPDGIPVIAICGSVTKDSEKLYQQGITAIFPSVASVSTFSEVRQDAEQNLVRTAENVARLLKYAK